MPKSSLSLSLSLSLSPSLLCTHSHRHKPTHTNERNTYQALSLGVCVRNMQRERELLLCMTSSIWLIPCGESSLIHRLSSSLSAELSNCRLMGYFLYIDLTLNAQKKIICSSLFITLPFLSYILFF